MNNKKNLLIGSIQHDCLDVREVDLYDAWRQESYNRNGANTNIHEWCMQEYARLTPEDKQAILYEAIDDVADKIRTLVAESLEIHVQSIINNLEDDEKFLF